ncbi:MAG: hypothetical protein V7754_22005, partial [Halioglobus sp.]
PLVKSWSPVELYRITDSRVAQSVPTLYSLGSGKKSFKGHLVVAAISSRTVATNDPSLPNTNVYIAWAEIPTRVLQLILLNAGQNGQGIFDISR